MEDEKDSLREAALLAPGLIHEMRHPLMGLKAGLQLIQAAAGAAVTEVEEWGMVQGQVARLEELFRCYQDFLEPGRVVPRPYPVSDVINRAVELLRYRLRRIGERFTIEISPTLMAYGTPNALLHAITNVLVNALDALEDTEGDGRLLLRAFQNPFESGRIDVRISDEGPGVPPALREKIFEPRFTTKPDGKGTGLGLAIARRMLAATGGDALLVPDDDPMRTPWARTEFALRLRDPNAPEQEEAKRAPGGPRPPTAAPAAPHEEGGGSAPRGRALVVDDERIIVTLLRRTLEGEDLEVSHAYTASAGLALLESQPFDLLVTDKNLPGGNGVDLAIQAKRRNPSMGILMITAYASKESADQMLQAGIDEYLQKPFEADYLARRVKQIISRRRALARLTGEQRSLDQVAVLVSTPEQTQHVTAGLEALHLKPIQLSEVDSPAALERFRGMVLSTLQCDARLRELIWKVQEERPGFPIVLLSDGRSLEDTIAGILIGAVGGLVQRGDAQGLKTALTQALG